MKKVIVIIFAIIALGITHSANAQKYLTFETKAFSVLLKCSPDYAKVQDISFSENGSWVSYKILKTLPLENKATGNRYVVQSKKAENFTVDYIYEKDREVLKSVSCSVIDQKTHVRTTLQRKK